MLNFKRLSKHDDTFDAIRYVLRARCKNGKRTGAYNPVFEMVKIEVTDNNVIMVCTDSRRLHLVELGAEDVCGRCGSDIKSGLYSVSTENGKMIVLEHSENNFRFPDYRQVIPGRDTESSSFTKTVTAHGFHGFVAQVIRALQDDLALNIDYLEDAVIIGDKIEVEVKTHGNGPVSISSGNSFALIMPIHT